jgi:hypothetical protein
MTWVGGIIGIALLGAFLGIMLWWVKALPIIIIVVVVMALVLYDWAMSARFGDDWSGR